MKLQLKFNCCDAKSSRNVFESNDLRRPLWTVLNRRGCYEIYTLYTSDGYWFEPDMPASVMAKYYDDGVDIEFEDGSQLHLTQQQFAQC